jgi:hypothetical protein
MRPRTLPVALLPRGSLVGRAEGREPRTLSTAAHQCHRFPGPKRLPPIDPIGPVPLLALRTKLWAATGPDWLCRRGPASDTRSLVQVRARSHPRAGYSPELVRPRAVYRLLQCVDSRARPPMSKPHRFFVATTEAAARRVTTPEGAANQAVSAQG